MLVVWAAAFVLLVTSSTMRGQAVNATLLGTVTDTTGAVVGKAKVTLTETTTGASRTSVTNESGNYEFPSIPPGLYEVLVENPGFKKQARRDVEVTVNSTVRVDLRLEPGATSETVVVTAEIPILQMDRADVGREMDSR